MAPPTRLDAEASLQLEVRQAGQRAVLFELSRFLQVSKVESDGVPVEFIHNQSLEGTQLARRGNDLIAVVFPQPLRAGQHINLHFVYGGEVLSEAGAGLLYVGARGTWYPNRGMGMARFDLRFVILLIGCCSRPASESTARPPTRRRVNNPAIGFPIVPCRLPASTWASTCG